MLALTAISIIAFVVLLAGSVLDWKGFSEDENDNSTFGDVTWTTFAATALLALFTGIAAWVLGRRRRAPRDVTAGQAGVGWFLLALAMTAIISALVN